MSAQYYAQRRMVPYRGVIHVVEVGDGQAYTIDGENWQARWSNPFGQPYFPGGGCWVEAATLENYPGAEGLVEAVRRRPPLPFPLRDSVELWLLDGVSHMPLALMQTRPEGTGPGTVVDSTWRPFRVEDNSFRAACLREQDAARDPRAWAVPHRDVLARQVNRAAQPHAIAQWFQRRADGSGEGLAGGLHVSYELQGRLLPPAAFPELLVREDWPEPLQAELARAYHAWNAPLLLCHDTLRDDTRAWLEKAACERPEVLLEVCRLIPKFVDRRAVEVALVAARLERAVRTGTR